MLKVEDFEVTTVTNINIIDDLQCALEKAMDKHGIESEGFCACHGQSFIDSETKEELARFVSVANSKITIEVENGVVVFDLI